MKKGLQRLLKVLGCLMLAAGLVLLTGTAYEAYQSKQDMKSYSPPGKLYEVSGRNMHLYTAGKGDVTVVFASGWGTPNPYVDFSLLYDKLKSKMKIAVYDRFGYGYSDYTDQPRDIDTISAEIHQLLRISGQRPPYILVAHSLGALETLRFAQMYPDEVAGMVIIDGGSPEYYSTVGMDAPEWYFNSVRFLVKTGIARTVLHSDRMMEKLVIDPELVSESMKKAATISALKHAYNDNVMDEMRLSKDNARRVLENKKEFSFPLTILTGGPDNSSEGSLAWQADQAKFSSWSQQGTQLIIPHADHYIHNSHPDLVATEIIKLVPPSNDL
ncbi:Putative aminoacrylate hydrolase RutD [Paenibacillus sp. JJ-100]|uniref:alpha/beta fold hydrolase n=1 Tax=Paenibacillus sp. JJ-100 TaxID=2974896 RepID=UPI0022FFAFCB|nr:alpha/beta hydrolase [Paenibacillus sp. JJ-100]CAI6016676.1 Putative aminoacrylate hydrolase RutD [Paenibacillus sp. JJ-100]